ncbi:MAG: carboxypeptidase regulatory-like domain-containing protein [Gemmatimonadaceae bacterium]
MRISLSSLGTLVLAGAVVAAAAHAQQPAPAPAAPAATGFIVGYIFDSTVTRPLAEANVQVVTKADPTHGTSFSINTDSSGFFRVNNVPPGEYLVTFFHARLDELGLNGPMKTVVVGSGRADIELGVPTTAHVIGMHCGARAALDSSGLLLGTVVTADNPNPVAGASVTAQWFELSFSARGMVRSTPTVRATTDANGRFRICGLPGDATLNVWAGLGKAVTGSVSVDVKPGRVATIELSLDVADTVLTATTSGPVHRGTARVSGVVRTPSGSVLPGARVALRGTDVETVADASGAYTLANLPGGTQTLEARAIGFVPISRSVTLSPKRALRFDVRFDSAARILQTVEVTGTRVYDSATQEFMEAKKRGFGYFIDRETIENRQPFQTSDLLRTAPGVTVYSSGAPGSQVNISIRGGGGFSGSCQPSIVIDGLQITGGAGDIDALARPEDITGMAVYRGASEIPVQYSTGSSCGLIQIWTRRGNTPRGKAK